MNKFDKLFYSGILMLTLSSCLLLLIIISTIRSKLNESQIYVKPIELEQKIIIRDTIYIERNKPKKHYKLSIPQPTVEIKQPQIIDTTKTQ